ncbi:hypothetical protein PO909_030584 [Leuciscus waleckii]
MPQEYVIFPMVNVTLSQCQFWKHLSVVTVMVTGYEASTVMSFSHMEGKGQHTHTQTTANNALTSVITVQALLLSDFLLFRDGPMIFGSRLCQQKFFLVAPPASFSPSRLPLLPSVNPLLCFPQKTSMSQDCSSSKLFSHSLQVFLLCLQTQRQKRQEMNALPTHHERMAEKMNNEVKQTLADVSLAELVQISNMLKHNPAACLKDCHAGNEKLKC